MSEPIRTQEKLTAGLVCVPLTKPATLFFLTNDNAQVSEIARALESLKIGYTTNWRNGKAFIKSLNQIEPKLMKLVRRNFTTLKPKFISDYRYPFWEIDTQDFSVLYDVLKVYAKWDLPVFVHKSMRGYHFICVKPISKSSYLKEFVPQVRHTNKAYPPIAIRIMANKWIGELDNYRDGFIHTASFHSDTKYIADWIMKQEITKIAQQYYVVRYPLPQEKPVINKGAI